MTDATATTSPEVMMAGDRPFAWLAERLHTTPKRVEYALGAILAVSAVAFVASLAPDFWFGGDEMEYLAHRSVFDFGDLFRPIGGHPTTWSVVLLRSLYGVFGLDWWPWFFLPRLIGNALLATLVWRVVRSRGADPLVALMTYAVLLVLGASGYQRAVQIGTWIVYAALILCATIIARPEPPRQRDRLIVAGALVIAILGNGYAIAVIAGLGFAALLARRLLFWLPSFLPAMVVYGISYLKFRADIRPKPEINIHKLLAIPAGTFRVCRTAVETGTGLPQWAAGLIVLAIAAWIVSLLVRRRLDVFDAAVLTTVAVGLALVTIQRISVDGGAADLLRYGYLVTVLMALALVPHIRLPMARWSPVAAVVIGVALVLVNANQLSDAMGLRAENGRDNRLGYEVAAGLIEAGEPVVAGPSSILPGLESDELLGLIDNGYHPDPPSGADEDVVEAIRGALRMNLIDLNRPLYAVLQRSPNDGTYIAPPGIPPTTDAPVDADGCVTVSPDAPVEATVTDIGLLTLAKDPTQALVLTWVDEFGTGVRRFDDPAVRRGAVELAEPATRAELTLESEVGELTVCGFSS